ncbi:hypothetical protein M9Y10_018245 [Tritrichomonas musculus]|uniref:Uncharacterized protein n=1 Tax=Tritrichomonas musculus TaxID=1915356 RepID=A0ABR2HPQ3_9EUKA
MFNLFDYNYLINHYDELSGEVVLDDPRVEEEKNLSNLQSCEAESMRQFLITFFTSRLSPSVILFIGKFASKVILISSSLSANLDTFYLDK